MVWAGNMSLYGRQFASFLQAVHLSMSKVMALASGHCHRTAFISTYPSEPGVGGSWYMGRG